MDSSSPGAGAIISHYRILSQLGAGGMGEVYLAEDTQLERKVAIKLLPAEFTKDPDRVRRFEQEAKAVSALNHPHIITIHEIGEAEAGRFIVMELVQGQTLRSLDKPCPLDTLVSLGAQIARALGATHAAGITHRDIKPENIMVRNDGYVKILDFGLARLIPGTATDPEAATLALQTMPGTLLGTVAYMSPEQARGETVTPATDVFALGIVFFELATGQHPFKADTMIGMLHSITAQAPLTPSRVNPDVPPALEALILRMLEKEAGKRPSAVEVDQALAELPGLRSSGQLQRPATSAATSAKARHTVGREKERGELHSGFASALSGRGLLLCVAGEPGIGKTTLVEDFLADLATEGRSTIARGRCSERLAGTEAYLPLLEAIESLLQSGSNPAAARVMKQIAPTWYAQVVPLSGSDEESARLLAEVKAASQERMKRELGNFLQEVARLRPLVLFFDDLHWADVSTIDLLSFLAGKFDALNVLIVVTYRPSDMLLAKHPFLQIKPDLQARGVCRELQLEFLNEAEIEQYLALEFPGHHFPVEFPKLIHAKTEGSPLFMADLVRYLRDRGAIALEDSTQDAGAPTWTLAQTLPDIERELPESVRGMIERKIAQLSEEDRKLLTAASVQGYEFDSAVVALVLNLEADEIEERLEKLERVYAFVKLTSEAEFPNRALTLRYRFVHVFYQNALYSSLRLTRKTSLSAAVAQSLEGFYGKRSTNVANELAVLWEAAREYARAAEYFQLAAEQASQVFATKEAATLARRGLTLVQSLAEGRERNEQELALQVTLGNALMATMGFAAQEVGQTYSRARELCEQLGETPYLLPVLFGLYLFHITSGNFREALELGKVFLDLTESSNDPTPLIAHRMMGCALYCLGELQQARVHFEQIALLYDPAQHRSLTWLYGNDQGMIGHSYLAWTLWLLGYPDQALQQSQEALHLGQEVSHAHSQAYALTFAAITHQNRRECQPALKLAEAAVGLATEQGLALWLAHATVLRGWAMTEQGNVAAGIDELRRGLDASQSIGGEILHPYMHCLLAEAYAKAKQPRAGLATLDAVQALVEKNDEHYWEAEVSRWRGELLLMDGASAAEAEQCFHQAIEIARRQSAKSLELRAVMSLARLWQQQGKIAEARQMLAEIYGWFTEGFDTADLKDAKALLGELQQQSQKSMEFSLQAVASEDRLKPELHAPSPSIAVLPFVNMSADAENEYFCDGLAEELLNALSKIEALRVVARTSAFSFKGKETDIREIGQKLNVGAVLEGSVRKSGNRLRITAQLINVADGYHLWSERYDREMQDIFDIQDEISMAIVDALKVKLLGAEKTAVLKRYTDNTEAYQLYLLGRFYYSKYTDEGFRKAIDYFEQAIKNEPNYAPAFAGMSNCYAYLWWYGYLSPNESAPQMKVAAGRALAIDNELAESHLCLARLKYIYEWDWAGAEREFKQCLELNPGYAEAHEMYGMLLGTMGRADEAMAEVSRALELDPFSLISNLNAGWIYWCIGQYDRMHEQGGKLIEIEPNFFGGYYVTGIELWNRGMTEQAIPWCQTAVTLGGGPLVLAALGSLYGIVGKRDKAQQVLHELQELDALRYVRRIDVALVYAGLGDHDRAIEWLEQAWEEREGNLIFLKHVVALIPGLSDDPRVAGLLRRIGLPE